MNEPDGLATAQRLGESYAALVGGTEWQTDEVGLSSPPTETTAPAAVEVRPSAAPPLAEPVNEPTVPPTPLQIVEALLFVGGPPLTAELAADAIRGLGPDQLHECVESLNRVYRTQNRPYAVIQDAAGYVLRVDRRYSPVRDRLYGGPREARLNQPALDVLSFIAYRQPVAKAEIDAARGADSGPVLRQLIRLGLIASTEALGESKVVRYETTPRFLQVFRLRDLDDLPVLGEPMRV